MLEILMTTALAASAAVPAYAAEVHRFNVPTEEAVDAIRDFAAQAHVQILVDGANVRDKHLHPVLGEFSTEKGLRVLLADSGLRPHYVGDHSIALVTGEQEAASSRGSENSQSADGAKEGKKSDSFRMGAVAQGASGSTSLDNAASSSSQVEGKGEDRNTIQEIIVTAQKKSERVQDVPVPVSVLDTKALTDSNQVLLRDYYASVPALSVSPNFAGQQMLSIRGISTGGFTNPVVGVLLDDVPYGTSTFYAGNQVPDIDPGDLDRVEVLRGPQGTLYGSNSMGGLLKFVTIDPSTDAVGGRMEVGTSSIHNGSEPGYNLRGSINIPVTNTFAVRASGFTRQDPGYIDNPVFNFKGVNQTKAQGARLAALWQPSDVFSLKLSALYQDTKANGSSDVNARPGLGDLEQNYISGIGGYERKIQAYSAVINAKLGGGVTLTSVTGYGVNNLVASLDFSSIFGPLVSTAYGIPGLGSAYIDRDNITKFSQELRFSGTIWRNLDWLVGGFYTHENAPDFEIFTAQVPATGQLVGVYWTLPVPTTFKETAAFADLTYHFTEQFDVQIGARESRDTVAQLESTQTGPFVGPTPVTTPGFESKANAFTYLLTPRFKVSPDLMVYARLASGYRPGGPNPSPSAGVPRQYEPDKTKNYELGLKADFLDHKLSIDTSIYYIDWKDIQVQQTKTLTFETNGSGAKSQGVEVSITSRPLTGLTASAWVVYDDAVLTEAFPPGPAYGIAGDRLPNTSKWSGNLALEQEFPLWADATGFVGGAVSFVGDRLSVFTGNAATARQNLPSYTKTDLRAGVKFDTWTANVYANNVADVRGLLNGGVGFDPAFAYVYIQPRTVGVSLVKKF